MTVNEWVNFNQEILKVEPRPVKLQPKQERLLTYHQLREEADEFIDAQVTFEAVDAIIDSLYYAYGALDKLGLDEPKVNRCFEAVHNKNMEKALGKVAKRDYGDHADAVKPDDWVGPEKLIIEIIGTDEWAGYKLR